MSTLLIVLALGLVAGVAAFATGALGRMGEAPPDREQADLPDDRAVLPADVDRVRFAIGLRGYRMDQVDGVLDRLASELDERDEYLAAVTAALEAAGVEVPERAVRTSPDESAAPDTDEDAETQDTEAPDTEPHDTDPDAPVESTERADA